VGFELCQKSDCDPITELHACQIQNHGLTIAFHDPFQFQEILGLDATAQSERHDIQIF
jgi:hypothetical protein